MTDVATEFADGVYFGLPEADYHADPALGSGDIKQLKISPQDWWWRSPFNTIYEGDGEEEKSALTLGDAIHKLILEGREAFDATFFTMPDPASYHDLLVTANDIKAWLKERGLPASGTKPELIARAKERLAGVNIWDDICEAHRAQHEGKLELTERQYVRALFAERFVQGNPDTAKMFTKGYPEVSIFWTVEVPDYDPVRCKARIDYLKKAGPVDLKTFSLQRGMTFNKGVMTAIARERYDIQAAHYLAGVRAMKGLPVFGTDDQQAFVATVDTDTPQWAWVFQKTTDAPLARSYRFDNGSIAFGAARHEVEGAIYQFCKHRKEFGMGKPWLYAEPTKVVDDGDLPAWMGQD